MRGATRRAWIKVYITGWLHGSVRWQLKPEERSVFIDLLLLAGECGREGEIADNDGKAFPLDFIANQLHIDVELLKTTLAKCQQDKRLILKAGVITIVNWKAYQSEYERVKKYRQQSSQDTDPDKYIKGEYGHMVKR